MQQLRYFMEAKRRNLEKLFNLLVYHILDQQGCVRTTYSGKDLFSSSTNQAQKVATYYGTLEFKAGKAHFDRFLLYQQHSTFSPSPDKADSKVERKRARKTARLKPTELDKVGQNQSNPPSKSTPIQPPRRPKRAPKGVQLPPISTKKKTRSDLVKELLVLFYLTVIFLNTANTKIKM